MTWNKFWTRWKDLDAFTYHEWARKVTETQINEWKASLYSILNIISHMNERTLSIWSAKQTNCKKREEKKTKNYVHGNTHTRYVSSSYLYALYMKVLWMWWYDSSIFKLSQVPTVEWNTFTMWNALKNAPHKTEWKVCFSIVCSHIVCKKYLHYLRIFVMTS